MLSSMLPYLQVVVPQAKLDALCKIRIAALNANIKTCNRTVNNAGLHIRERLDAADQIVELENKRRLYQDVLDAHCKMVTA